MPGIDMMIVDLHLHSHYSRATSPDMTLSRMYQWGKIKGIDVIGTADFTHPDWFAELRKQLEPAEPGLFRLKNELAEKADKQVPESCRQRDIRFVLTVEISNIYSKYDAVRKLHNVIVVPSFEAASALNARLDRIGNLAADGRPILGMDSADLLRMTLETDPDALFIPAHIWTPWFSMFGSRSGFDSLDEAFGDLAEEISVVETGLSSDPAMNWRVSDLDGIALVSNSDAHSPAKLGREANLLDCELSYREIIGGIRTNDERLVGTIEFFPQEGKYHHDGHRKCDVSMSPAETKAHDGICPACGEPIVRGVRYRVDELADRPVEDAEGSDQSPSKNKTVEYIIPLTEIIAEIEGVKSTNSKTVQSVYRQLNATLGDEFSILRTVPLDEIRSAGFDRVAHALGKMRAGDVYIEPGYDGVYGIVRIYGQGDETAGDQEQLGMFDKTYMAYRTNK